MRDYELLVPLDKYIGIPFKDNGRDFYGCDCYGLVWLFYRDILGIELPKLSDEYDDPSDVHTIQELITRYHQSWEPSTGQWGDLLVFRGLTMSRNSIHLAVLLEPGKMLHTVDGTDSCLDSYESSLWRNRLHGAFHYKNRTLS